MKRPVLLLSAIVVGSFILILYWSHSSTPLVGPVVRLAVFATGTSTKGILSVPFTDDVSSPIHASVYIGERAIADGISIRPRKDGVVGIPVSLDTIPKAGDHISIRLVQENHNADFERVITEIATESKDVLQLAKVTKPELSMKGLLATIAYAQVTEAARLVPDIAQQIAECAPTSAADSLISLAQEHGMEGKLPDDASIINDLKGEMQWTPANGVLPEEFVAGKDRWAAKHGLPIRTHIVGDARGHNSLQGILDAMAKGSTAAELRMRFTDAHGRTTGGHMVAVSSVRVEGDKTFIEVSDPRTPEGSDTYEVDGDTIVGYPIEGAAHISFGFVQTWEGTPTGAALDTMTDTEVQGIQNAVGIKAKIQVISVYGHKVPLSQVHVGKGPECDQMPHYHANTGTVVAIDGTKIVDPEGCGFGKVVNVPVEQIDKP